MTAKRFQQLHRSYLKAVWKEIDKRTDLYDEIERASNSKVALKAAKEYYRECLKFDRALEKFISQLERSN